MKVWRTVESEGLTAEEAAERFSVTERTIFRMISRCKEALLELNKDEVLALVAD
jgi:predicted DNA-binding transcriptional regulator YafY